MSIWSMQSSAPSANPMVNALPKGNAIPDWHSGTDDPATKRKQNPMTFDPFDRTTAEAKRERASIGTETLHGKAARNEIRECFRVNRYGK